MYKLWNAICEVGYNGRPVIIIDRHVESPIIIERLAEILTELGRGLDITGMEQAISAINNTIEHFNKKLIVHKAGILMVEKHHEPERWTDYGANDLKEVLYSKNEPLMVPMGISLVLAIMKYSAINPATIEDIYAYVEHGQPSCEFVHAVLINDLTESFAMADSNNAEHMHEIVSLMYNWCPNKPASGRGSPEAYNAWLQKARELREKKTDDN